MTILLFLHVVSVVVWVGGMFLAYVAVRPVAAQVLEPPLRLQLWDGIFRRFFPWVWAAVLLIVGSGMAMIARMGAAPHYVMAMMGIGLVMAMIFLHLYFAPYGRLTRGRSQGLEDGGGGARADPHSRRRQSRPGARQRGGRDSGPARVAGRLGGRKPERAVHHERARQGTGGQRQRSDPL